MALRSRVLQTRTLHHSTRARQARQAPRQLGLGPQDQDVVLQARQLQDKDVEVAQQQAAQFAATTLSSACWGSKQGTPGHGIATDSIGKGSLRSGARQQQPQAADKQEHQQEQASP